LKHFVATNIFTVRVVSPKPNP